MGAVDVLPSEDPLTEFFAPTNTTMLDTLLAEYRHAREQIREVVAFSQADTCRAVIGYFCKGNATDERGSVALDLSAAQIFREAGAVAALNAAYWSRALDMTDVYDLMPQQRRNEWNAQIRNPLGIRMRGQKDKWETLPLPDFEEDTVRTTIQSLLMSRAQFFAERVDGIYRALSPEHLTNNPMGFGRRMIIARLINSFGSGDRDRVGYINDLRCVIAKFMGREEPKHWDASSYIVDMARKQYRGQWITLDGGSLRLRAYYCGTAHLEVHPDIAWRLNCVLAHLHPTAIPSEFRQKPKKKPKQFTVLGRPVPFPVVELLSKLKPAARLVAQPNNIHYPYRREPVKDALEFEYYYRDNAADLVMREAEAVLSSIGGVKQKEGWWQFDYEPQPVINEIVCSGCVPDQKAHQFYPTPPALAARAIELAEISDEDECLEPSAGQGGIADLMPKERTVCVEISKLHCEILAAKGYTVSHADFLSMPVERKFHKAILNPPFSEGRWAAHTQHAALMLKDSGRLVAILPASAKGKEILEGFTHEWHGPYENQFSGTSTSVVILVAQRAAAK